MTSALKNRLFAALGVTAAGGLAFAQTAPPSAAPARPAPWVVSYPLPGNPPSWCARGSAQCEATGPTCAPAIRVAQGCTPGTACMHPDALTDAPLNNDVTRAQRSSNPRACCYTLPQHCVPPWAGRSLSDGAGADRIASIEARSDWGARGGAPANPGAWALSGVREHAAVASFAQTVLRLLRFAAPASLVEQTLRAALDEVAHARACFARAEAAGEGSVGPGALDAGHGIEHDSIELFALDTLREGCVAETLGAADASQRAERANDPSERAHWSRIAEEESRHAELSWSTLRWLLSVADESALDALRAQRATIASRTAVCAGGEMSPDDVTHAIVLPCLDALIDSRGASS